MNCKVSIVGHNSYFDVGFCSHPNTHPLFFFASLFISPGNRAACINAATMALVDAGVPMKEFVCACSAGYLEDTPIIGEG